MHTHHHHNHVPPELAKLANDDVARANKGLDMLIELYRTRQDTYDRQGLNPLMRLLTFAREIQPSGALLSGPTVMLTIAVQRLVDQRN